MPIRHKVKPGDCISSIALDHGLFPDTIWNDPDNAALKTKREDPNVLLEGDQVVIPDKQPKEVTKPDAQRHRFRRKGVPEMLRLQFLGDGDSQPWADEPYTIDIDGRLFTGRTSAQGTVEQRIPPDARRARVFFQGRDIEYQFDLGHLDPADKVKGAQGRLKNLGYYDGPLDGGMTEATTGALVEFQIVRDLPVTGELTPETANALKDAYGG